MLNVQIFLDVICPFCYMGIREFFNAVKKAKLEEPVQMIYRSFQLDPNYPKDKDEDNDLVIARKYNRTVEEIQENSKAIATRAHSLGLQYKAELMRYVNTEIVHRIAKYAKTENKEIEWLHESMRLYFSSGARLNNQVELLAIAEQIGLNIEKVTEVIKSDAFLEVIHEDREIAEKYQVTSVPTFILNNQYVIIGAQNEKTFLSALEQLSNASQSI